MIELRSQCFNVSFLDVTEVLCILQLTEAFCQATKSDFNKVNLLFQ